MPLYLSKAQLRRHSREATEFLSIVPTHSGDSPCALGHHLVWTLFPNSDRRDFLWRDAGYGSFWVLSERCPHDGQGVLSILPPKEFPDVLPNGIHLRFSLRANAVTRVRGKKHDVVMHALSALNGQERCGARRQAVQESGWHWLSKQADIHGFSVNRKQVRIDGYQAHVVRKAGGHRMRFCTMDFDGICHVMDSAKFMSAIRRGIGSSKGFGNGLLLLSPV